MFKDLFLLALIGPIVSAGSVQTPRSITSISVDFPHGENNLRVFRNGEAFLFYGALPQHLVIKRGVFKIDRLYPQLRPKLHPNVPAEQRVGKEFGMVIIKYSDGGEKSYLIYDAGFAADLFKKARKNVVSKTGDPPIRRRA